MGVTRDLVVADRYCRRGHELIPGETAYVVEVWTWCRIGCRRLKGEAAHAADTTGNVRWNPTVGILMHPDRAGGWEHRTFELRCRECNRQRVAACRAKRKAVIGGGPATAYTGEGQS
jgi:hypothetical protein